MDPVSPPEILAQLDKCYRTASRQILAALVRLFRDFDLAEDGLQEAFKTAHEVWPAQGIPANPVGWLIAAGRFRILDQLRRARRSLPGLDADVLESPFPDFESSIDEPIPDDQLRLIFLCCHPGLSDEAQIALTLREVCGLTTEEIASAFLQVPAAIGQRIVRAKRKIRSLGFPFELPPGPSVRDRLATVLHVIYLTFNEGYFASRGDNPIRADLVDEAIRLCRIVDDQWPDPEVAGLLALMVLQKARLPGRLDSDGDLVLLEDQDRKVWDPVGLKEGALFVQKAFAAGQPGVYGLQAAIVAVHCSAPSVEETDWKQIVALYEQLLTLSPSPVAELNLCAALSRVKGPSAALGRLEPLVGEGAPLARYASARTVRGELAHQLGDWVLALNEWKLALELTDQEGLRRYLLRKISLVDVEK